MLLPFTFLPFLSVVAAASTVGWLVKNIYQLFVVSEGF